ncbi:MAG: AI-2E family transporter [Ignavibacteriae bacterium]|nr:MAG: AI-2E family transporter [Ignavibacteriota bacterium]
MNGSSGLKHQRLPIQYAERVDLGIRGFYPKGVAKMEKRQASKKSADTDSPEPKAPQNLRWDSLFTSHGRIEIVLLVGGVLLLMVLIYTIHEILSPFLALGAIIFILFPLRRYVLARNIMWLAIVLFSLWFLNAIATILAPFVVSMIFAYMLNPVVDLFESWKIPRWVTSLVLILLFITSFTLFLFFVLPIALTQFEGVLDTVSRLVNDYRDTIWDSHLIKILERYGISVNELRNTFSNQLTPRFEDILKTVLKGLGSLMTSISGFITQIFYIVLVPFLTFYFLTDFPKIGHRFLLLFPRRNRDQVEDYLRRGDDLIGHYLRGALTVAFLQGIIVAILFTIVGIKYALLLGLLACVFDLVPYFGLVAIMALSAVIALFSDPPVLTKLSIAVVSIAVLHMTEITFLSPKIIGSKVGLHPLLIILSLLIFMYFLGFVGLLIAVPTTALTILFIRDWEAKRRSINPYPEESSASDA